MPIIGSLQRAGITSLRGIAMAEGTPEQTRIALLRDGDYFGEIALLKNVTRTASVKTLTPCTFLSLQREQFSYLLERAPHLRARLEQVLTSREAEGEAERPLTKGAAHDPLTRGVGLSTA
ncbi:cyclic nucleotide-binding domain-containing protein [Mesorhizobium sp.]|uniref:cyclic nucleotide-binding domain-containing protein n=1 Tax=Mesorhizobium sp. TaxID=1871066 RepID=UPI000FE3D9AA|nr:cyclic nucleotide-binding domain-containing protein [Mesorhizobium sp.]RWC03489.1 MAG: cyclic nucleotide-binding domain-containing protein [Mesorhizobium sp.]RWP04505.1 MAG: cyclic nucleotide-binding domain-containing protein [Mesorhizobium sp.]RWP10808.1 MAG: cyclic nucleotide-binding domain-containing protein [Mesorhizobium sp.]RWP33191.1 MAG: cyclic nucleotide-binding domain-containing protein [Mesorhizobium sp.]RWP69019.1 MAG: cyclic nucleotide-binding domain-containing protein [Mesorhi